MDAPIEMDADKMVGHVGYGSIPIRSGGLGILLCYSPSMDAAPLAYHAMTLDEAEFHAADICRLVIAIRNSKAARQTPTQKEDTQDEKAD